MAVNLKIWARTKSLWAWMGKQTVIMSVITCAIWFWIGHIYGESTGYINGYHDGLSRAVDILREK